VRHFNFLADDGLVDALLMELSDLLDNFIAHDRPGSIDLLGLPLSASCLAALEQRLGHGEISATIRISGESETRETGFPGIWWTSHADEAGRIIAMLIEVTDVPDILRAGKADMALAQTRLKATTSFAEARRTA
jgi:hydrogenase-1 operon protein HyaF